MPQPILGIKGTAEYIEASGNGTLESPYIPTVYVANPGSGGSGGISSTVSITGTLPGFATTPTFNIGTSLLAIESGGNLTNINAKIPSNLTVTANRLLTDGSQVTQPVSLSSQLGYLSQRYTALSNTPQAIKASPGFLMGWNFININTIPVYVKFYNSTVANTNISTSTPVLTLFIPPGSTSVPGVFFQEASLIPQEVFSTAITIACVTGLTAGNNTAPSTPIHASAMYL
jgi:hypothetical protein